MKKLFIFLGFFGLVACSDDKTEDLLPGQKTPLEVTLNSTSLCRGETLTATIRFNKSDEGPAEARTDFQLYFETIEDGAPSDLFANFPSEVTFPADKEQITVDFPIKESGFTDEHKVKLWVSAEGRAITGAAQTITIGEYHYITVSVKGAASTDVTEGQTFVLQAEIAESAPEDLVVTLKAGDDSALADFENFPETLTIEAGETVAESAEVTVAWDNGETQEDHVWNFTGTVGNEKYMVNAFTITRIDSDLAKGERLLDERWVYDYPDRAFYSKTFEEKYKVCPSYKEGDMLMTKNSTFGLGSKHPNRSLSETWTLLNALEFHALPGANSGSTRYGVNEYGNCKPFGMADQNTKAIQETCYVSNDKFSNVTDEGILRLWAAKDPGNATGGGSGSREFGAAALYSSKIGNNTFAPQNTLIRVGTRVEVRARVSGALQGFNYAIWLMGNSNNKTTPWPQCGEIDIMENPVFTSNVAGTINTVHQTLHYGTPVGDAHANPTVNKVIKPTDWNIYWVEIVDESTIVFGINGEKTATFTKTNPNFSSYQWPFNNTDNVNGFHFLLTAGLAAEWACGPLSLEEVNAGGWAASEFLNLTYEQTKTSDLTPRMEIDWVRFWINENYTTEGAGGVNNVALF